MNGDDTESIDVLPTAVTELIYVAGFLMSAASPIETILNRTAARRAFSPVQQRMLEDALANLLAIADEMVDRYSEQALQLARNLLVALRKRVQEEIDDDQHSADD